jgi:hypothetical protein
VSASGGLPEFEVITKADVSSMPGAHLSHQIRPKTHWLRTHNGASAGFFLLFLFVLLQQVHQFSLARAHYFIAPQQI